MNAGHYDSLRADRLQWLPELGLGWYPVCGAPYDAEYWSRYRKMDRTPTGAALTEARIGLVAKHWGGELVDVGIGGGRFVDDRPHTQGYDINPHAVQWLHDIGRWRNPYDGAVMAASFWDSLEHIHDPARLLRNITQFVFVSLPIFSGSEHVLRSRHYRKDEHCWYFTERGIVWFMNEHGFSMIEQNVMEQEHGREDIGTYVFGRRA